MISHVKRRKEGGQGGADFRHRSWPHHYHTKNMVGQLGKQWVPQCKQTVPLRQESGFVGREASEGPCS